MLNTVYQLVAPRRFEVAVREEEVGSDCVVVRPTHLSICNADQRYYQGTRGAEILAEKLPMALIHEGVGTVLVDYTGHFSPGDSVAMIPNLPSEKSPLIAENYLRSSRFRGSSADGFLQDLVVTSPDRLVLLPDGINLDVAAFTELVSVAMHAIGRFASFSRYEAGTIGIWGDGNLGFITALLARYLLPTFRVAVIGHNEEKLSDFTFVDESLVSHSLPDDFTIDGAFECAGGTGSESAISQIIKYISPEATISLMGVSENSVPVNTRMILEKGLRLFGSSRSGRDDFIKVISFYAQHPDSIGYLERIVGQVFDINSIDDIANAFEADIRKRLGKTIMHWNK